MQRPFFGPCILFAIRVPQAAGKTSNISLAVLNGLTYLPAAVPLIERSERDFGHSVLHIGFLRVHRHVDFVGLDLISHSQARACCVTIAIFRLFETPSSSKAASRNVARIS